MGALLRFWPLLAAIFAAGSASGVAIYQAATARSGLAEFEEQQLTRERAQWQRMAEIDDKLDAVRVDIATLKAHH
jgi:hypothetical protein